MFRNFENSYNINLENYTQVELNSFLDSLYEYLAEITLLHSQFNLADCFLKWAELGCIGFMFAKNWGPKASKLHSSVAYGYSSFLVRV